MSVGVKRPTVSVSRNVLLARERQLIVLDVLLFPAQSDGLTNKPARYHEVRVRGAAL